MPLILAVEPDPRRAAHVRAITHGRTKTELVLAESTAAAITAVASRIPDVLLLSPSLTRDDRAHLDAWLKRLGPAGMYVKTLPTPTPPPTGGPTLEAVAPRAVERRPTGPATAPPPPAAQPSQAPQQNEWGLHDPRLCGLSALKEREPDEGPADAAHVSVRVITY